MVVLFFVVFVVVVVEVESLLLPFLFFTPFFLTISIRPSEKKKRKIFCSARIYLSFFLFDSYSWGDQLTFRGDNMMFVLHVELLLKWDYSKLLSFFTFLFILNETQNSFFFVMFSYTFFLWKERKGDLIYSLIVKGDKGKKFFNNLVFFSFHLFTIYF